jgi:lipopolysaccharide export system ATP-binding protein
MVIAAQNLTLAYGDKRIVKNVSLDVGGSTVTALIGPSGCGKSTLLDIIMGLLSPNKGFIYIDKTKISKSPMYPPLSYKKAL